MIRFIIRYNIYIIQMRFPTARWAKLMRKLAQPETVKNPGENTCERACARVCSKMTLKSGDSECGPHVRAPRGPQAGCQVRQRSPVGPGGPGPALRLGRDVTLSGTRERPPATKRTETLFTLPRVSAGTSAARSASGRNSVSRG